MKIRARIVRAIIAPAIVALGAGCTSTPVEPPRVALGLVTGEAPPPRGAWFESRLDDDQGVGHRPYIRPSERVTVQTWDREWARDGRIRNQRWSRTRIESVIDRR